MKWWRRFFPLLCDFLIGKSKFQMCMSLLPVTLLLIILQALILKWWRRFFPLLCDFVIWQVWISNAYVAFARYFVTCEFTSLHFEMRASLFPVTLWLYNFASLQFQMCRSLLPVTLLLIILQALILKLCRRFFPLLCDFAIWQAFNFKCVCRFCPLLCYL